MRNRSYCYLTRYLRDLIQKMWLEPEASFYYYHGHMGGPGIDPPLQGAKYCGKVLMDDRERRHYKRPHNARDYVRITPTGEDEYRWPWEREVVEKGPEFWRTELKLSPRQREELDAWRKVQIEERYRQEARDEKYTYDVFLSYSSKDEKEAQIIHDKIVASGHEVFMAPKVLDPGDDFAEEIRLALHGSKELWLLVSPSSLGSE